MKNRPHSYISLPTIYSDDPVITTPIVRPPRRKSFQQDRDDRFNQRELKTHYPPLLSSIYDPITKMKQHQQQEFIMDYFYSKELPPTKRKKKVTLELKSTTIMTGQWIEGNIVLDFDLNDIIHLELCLQGIESVMDESYNYSIKTHTYSFLKTTILSLNGFQVDKYNDNPMQRKEWKIPFKYQLPTHFHYSSSYEDKQCAIEYALQCDITARSANTMIAYSNRHQKKSVNEEKEEGNELYQTQKLVKLYHHVLPEELNEFDQPIKEHKKIWENIPPSSSPSFTAFNNNKKILSLKNMTSASSPYVDLTINMNRSFWIAGSSLYVTMQIKNHSMNTIQDIQLDLIKRQNTYLSSPLTSGFDLMPITSTSETILSTPVSSFDWWYIIEPAQHDHVILSLPLPVNEFTIKHQKLIDISYSLRISICSSLSTESVTELPIYIIQPHTMESLQNEEDTLSNSVICKEQQQQNSKKDINEKDLSSHSLSTVSSSSTSSHYSAFLPVTTSSTSIDNKNQHRESQQQLEQLQKGQKEKREQLQMHQKHLEQLQKKQQEKRQQLQRQQQQQQQQLLLQPDKHIENNYHHQHQQQKDSPNTTIKRPSLHVQSSSKAIPSPSTTENSKNQKNKKWNKKNIYQWVKKKSHQYFDKQQQQDQMKEREGEEVEILKSPIPTTNHYHIISPKPSYSTPSPSRTKRVIYYDDDNPVSSPFSPQQQHQQQPSLISSSGLSSSDSSFSTSTSSCSKKETKKIKTPLLQAKRPFIKKCKSFVSTPTSKHVSFIKNNDSLFFNQEKDMEQGQKEQEDSIYSQKLEIPPSQHLSFFLSPQTAPVHPFMPKKKRPTSFYGTSMLNYLI